MRLSIKESSKLSFSCQEIEGYPEDAIMMFFCWRQKQ